MKVQQLSKQKDLHTSNLVRHCLHILVLYGDLKNTQPITQDYSTLYSELQQIIRALEIKLGTEQFTGETIKLTSYALCCALDEAMNHVGLISDSVTDMNASLLFLFHNEMPQSDNLLKLAKRVIDQRNTTLIEVQKLIYMIIELGYRGASPENADNANLLYSIKRVLANNVIAYNKTQPTVNYISVKSRNTIIPCIPLWLSLSFSVLIIVAAYRIADTYLSSMHKTITTEQKILDKNRPSKS